ncbi:FG-GAP repeat protein [Chloracidobacterium sp. MS 40/45]|nr:IPT/TIG domain-containing protein [Chloracidobacterium aggregatum]QUW01563.1 FG-GAP repeat protein [Chloracidobacterium sp. MS 40/45]
MSTVNVGNAVDNPEPVVDLQVCFNDVPAAFEVVSDTQILATVPSGATTGPIKVQRDDEEFAVSSVPFVVTTASAPTPPIISNFTPPAGPVGTVVSIFGTNFADVLNVRFNGVAATFSVSNTTQITATVPAGATTGPITVTTTGGTATATPNFIVTTGPTPPIITNFTPPSGPVGTVVSIFGANFADVLNVRFNAVNATFTVVSPTQITATVPAGATTGPITVTTTGGTATATPNFIVTTNPAPPVITNFTPPSGPVGTVVSIFGANFADVLNVRFNGVNAMFTVVSPTQITATVPAGATTGPITVTTAGGTATATPNFIVTTSPTPPVITNFTPPSGPVGTVVSIFGANFTDVLNVRFNAVNATFTVVSLTQITATVPAGAATGPITVTTTGGTAISREPFVVLETPTLTSFSPASGPVGTPVTITGTNFLNVSSVTFGDLPARFTVTSPTQITATVPAGAVTAPIRVVTPAGSATSATSFTVIPRVPPQTIGLWRPNQGFLMRQSNTAGPPDIAVPLGQTGDQPVVGDWDGDGRTTVALFRAGQFLIRNENTGGAPVTTVTFGQAGDIPVAGDWTGKGFDSVGVFRRGLFLLRNTNTSGAPDIVINYGLPTDLPVVGDWDGDGRTTVGAFRPSTGFFFLRNENSSGNADLSFFYGLANDLPVAGDWDGDGVTTVGIFRAGTFFLRNTNTAGFADVAAGFGQAGDVPLAGRWKTPPVVPPGDFQTGNSTVVWRNQTTGETSLWVMQGTTFVRSEALPFVEDCWVVGGTADFNGDGATDLLWRNQDITGFDAVWTFAGLRPTAALPVTPEQTDRNWFIGCTGDFNRDGQPDIVRRNLVTDAVEVWLMNRLTRSAVVPLVIPGLTADERIVGSGDFEGNGQLGLLLHRPAAGTARVVTFIGATAVGSRPLPAPGTEWRLAAVGDYNRDGQADVVWRNERTGQNVIWLLRNLSLVQSVALPAVPDQRWQIVGPR